MVNDKNTKRAKRSFLPKVVKPTNTLHFRGDGAKYIGESEPTWPSIEDQATWTHDQYGAKLGEAFNWYANSMQENKKGFELAIAALSLSGHFPELIAGVKNSLIPIANTSSWLIRMARMGLFLRFHERRMIVKALHKCMDNQKVVATVESKQTTKPNIQEFISAKLRKVRGEIDLTFDAFVENNYVLAKKTPTVAEIIHSGDNSIPANRINDMIEYATSYLNEYKMAMSGKNVQLVEAYSRLGKKEFKAAIAFWEGAIIDFNTFGQLKKSVRKTRKKKVIPPTKIVGKLRYVKTFAPLKLESFDPTLIMKSSEIWVYNTKTKKLGHFVALPNSTFDVKGTRILNLDTVKSVQKTLRKPAEQLKQFNSYSKPGAMKWFKEIRAVATKLKEALNKDSVLLKAVK